MRTTTFIAFLSAITTLTVSPIIHADSTSGAASQVQVETVDVDVDTVEVETVEVAPTDTIADPAANSASKEKAGQLWDKTREETGEAVSAAADYSKTQGSRAIEGTKKGVAKGAGAVAEASKKVWEATKETTDQVLDSTGKALKKTGAALQDALE